MKDIFRFLIVLFCLFTGTNPLHAQWIQSINPVFSQEGIIQKFEKDSVQMGKVLFHYGLFKPENPEAGKKYPLILALHGGEHFDISFGEFMSTFPFHLAIIWATPELQDRYPCYILTPHITNDIELTEGFPGCIWWDPEVIDFLDTIIDNFIIEGQIDTNRIYITGHSVGGWGTFKTPLLLKRKVAAIAPMSSAIDTDDYLTELKLEEGAFKNLPVWCFHHRDDEYHPPVHVRSIFNKLDDMNYNTVYTGSFGNKMYNLPGSSIQNHIESHQKYLYTEYYYASDNTHQIFYTASVDTLWHKWLFQQYKLDDQAIGITKIDSSNSMELNWMVKNQQDEVEIWVKTDIEWVLLAKRKFSQNTFKLDSALENQNSSIETVRIAILNNEGFVYGIDERGKSIYHPTLLIKEYSAPENFSLAQNYPNPFNSATTISFRLPSKSFVSLKVFDLLGREVATIVSEELSAGSYTRTWNAANISSGVYFYRLQAGSYIETKKLILLR
jgi:hypothetical protein